MAVRNRKEDPKPEAAEGAVPDGTVELKPGSITAPRFAILTVGIEGEGGSPLVLHNFSSEQRNVVKATQARGST